MDKQGNPDPPNEQSKQEGPPPSVQVPCPFQPSQNDKPCGARLYFPPNYRDDIVNLPYISMFIVSHPKLIQCGKCGSRWTIQLMPGVKYQVGLALLPGPPEDQGEIAVVRDLPSNLKRIVQ